MMRRPDNYSSEDIHLFPDSNQADKMSLPQRHIMGKSSPSHTGCDSMCSQYICTE